MTYESTDTIQRCPHDPENPYCMISRALIRDKSISPECRWLITYLLCNKDGWNIKVKQVIAHLENMMCKTSVYKIFDEAMEAGYIKRDEYLEGGKKRYRYYVSECPKFKKCLLFPKKQETAAQDTAKCDTKGIPSSKVKYLKDSPLTPPKSEAPESEPPSKEEEEEISKRIRERPKNAKRIVNQKKYREEVLKDIRSSPGSSISENMSLAKEVERKLILEGFRGRIEVSPKEINIFTNGHAYPFTLAFSENGFKQQLASQLRKMGYFTIAQEIENGI